MKYQGVKFFLTNAEKQIVTDIFYLKNDAILHCSTNSKTQDSPLKELLTTGYNSSNGKVFASSPIVFLSGLKYLFSGSYFRASDILEIDESEIH